MFDLFLLLNKSIAGIFWASLLLFIVSFLLNCKKRWVFIALLTATVILIGLLINSNSRAGWLGYGAGLIYIFYCKISLGKRKIVVGIAIFCWFLFLSILFFYKSDSSSGRKHIYSISAGMLKDNWVHGIGLGKFKSSFNEYQADYFSTHDIDSKRALLADNTFYAFNDYLQLVIETGILGFLFLIATLYLFFKRIVYLQKEISTRPILLSSVAVLICVATAALFSYPLQILSLQAVALICLGIIAFYPGFKSAVYRKQKITAIFFPAIVIMLAFIWIMETWKEIHLKLMTKDAFELARSGYKTKAINRYKQLLDKYPEAGYNWFSYAQQLYYSNQLNEAANCLDRCRLYYVDNKVYKLKADIELELKKYNMAEKDYLRTIYMVPNRMGSRFDLLNFYIFRKDTLKSLFWAKSILNMTVKVPSKRTSVMLKQTKDILDKLENK